MLFLELEKALRDYLKDEAIKTFEGVLNLDKEEFKTLKWLFQQDSFPDVKHTYKEYAKEDNFVYIERKHIH